MVLAMRSFFKFGPKRVKVSISKAALGIESQIKKLTSEIYTTFLLLKEYRFDPSTIFIFRI